MTNKLLFLVVHLWDENVSIFIPHILPNTRHQVKNTNITFLKRQEYYLILSTKLIKNQISPFIFPKTLLVFFCLHPSLLFRAIITRKKVKQFLLATSSQ